MKSKLFPAVAVLVGTTIGAGFLGLPYVFAKSGFLIGLAYLIIITFFILLIKLYTGEIILRTNGNHQLAGYAKKYLGRTGGILMFFAMIFGIYSALVAYLIGEGKSLSYVFLGDIKYYFYFSILFWIIMSALAYIGLKALKKYEKIAMIIILSFVCLIFVFFVKSINIDNLSYINSENFFLPFGVVLFSYLAFSAMPEVRRVLSKQENLMKKTVFLGVLIPFLFYLIFAFVVVGNFGLQVPEIATLALGRFFSLLGVFTMFTAFFTLTLSIRDMFRFDFGLGRFRGWLLAVFIPLILFLIIYFFNIAGFVQIISISGVISGGLTGILIVLMAIKAKKIGKRKPEYSIKLPLILAILLILFFIAGLIFEFVL